MSENAIPAPQHIQFGQTPSGEHKRVDFDGIRRTRRKARRRPNIHTLTWTVDADKRKELEALHRDKGAETFEMNLPGPEGLTGQPVNFWGPLTITPDSGKYKVSAQIKVRNPTLMLAGDMEAALVSLLKISNNQFAAELYQLTHFDLDILW